MFDFLSKNTGKNAKIALVFPDTNKTIEGKIVSTTPETLILDTQNGMVAVNIKNIVYSEVEPSRNNEYPMQQTNNSSSQIIPSLNNMERGLTIFR